MTRNFSHKNLISNHKTYKREREGEREENKALKCSKSKQTASNKGRNIDKVELEKRTGIRSCVLKLRAIPFITVYSMKTGHYCLTLMQWIKYIIPTLCVSSWKDQGAFRINQLWFCDVIPAQVFEHSAIKQREKRLWILSAASSKVAGLPFHISALRFDIYEHKLSTNELTLQSGPPTQHRQTHTHKDLNTLLHCVQVWANAHQHTSNSQFL